MSKIPSLDLVGRRRPIDGRMIFACIHVEQGLHRPTK